MRGSFSFHFFSFSIEKRESADKHTFLISKILLDEFTLVMRIVLCDNHFTVVSTLWRIFFTGVTENRRNVRKARATLHALPLFYLRK